jgi:alpha-mannosidase
MKNRITRRNFLRTGALGTAGAFLVWPALKSNGQVNDPPDEGVCVCLCNHWSYIGIGWQLGIESNVLSAIDSIEMSDRPPYVKTCLNLDARAYEFMAEKFPEVAARLSKYLAAGKVELIGGSYGQPLGTSVLGESNIRQIVLGREVIRKVLGYEMVTFLEEEEFTHPQLPQIIAGTGFKYGSMAQVDTWGRAGIPVVELNALHWKGIDGSTIVCSPRNELFGWAPDTKTLTSPVMARLKKLGKPLIFTWAEFGWEDPETPSYLTSADAYIKLAEKTNVEYVTLQEYMDKYNQNPKETVYFKMDEWNKSLAFGLGGDQIRIYDRQLEGLLLAAECFDALASTLGARAKPALMEKAWKDHLASQSHDVALCEYSRWQGNRMMVLDRVEDLHNFTWGALGYNHMDTAQKQGKEILDDAMAVIVKNINSKASKKGPLAVTVFNPSGWGRSEVVATGRIYPINEKAKGIIVRDSAGREIPSQLIKQEVDKDGNLIIANVAFVAEKVPSVGYDTYYLEMSAEVPASISTTLKIDESNLELENEFLKVKLDPDSGGISSLIDKRTGKEMLNVSEGAFPVFKGKPNMKYPLRSIFDRSVESNTSYEYSTAKSKAELRWLERGPVRATLRAQHSLPRLKFETQISLSAGQPYVEIVSRVLAQIPPATDVRPADIKEGYWLSFAPAFEPTTVLRDFPLAIEATTNKDFHALTFVDFCEKNDGLLLLHPGTQWFKRDDNGIISNLIMREWESHFTGEYGWPRYADYKHGLYPHLADFTNAQRTQAAAEFTQKLITVVGPVQSGKLPVKKSFISVTPDNVQLSAFRKTTGNDFELRVLDVSGQESAATVELSFPLAKSSETDFLGTKIGEVSKSGNKLQFPVTPWKIRTFRVS